MNPSMDDLEAQLRAVVYAQQVLWDARGALERALGIRDDDWRCGRLNDCVNTLAAGGGRPDRADLDWTLAELERVGLP